jgi:hypothetical protein
VIRKILPSYRVQGESLSPYLHDHKFCTSGFWLSGGSQGYSNAPPWRQEEGWCSPGNAAHRTARGEHRRWQAGCSLHSDGTSASQNPTVPAPHLQQLVGMKLWERSEKRTVSHRTSSAGEDSSSRNASTSGLGPSLEAPSNVTPPKTGL